MSIIKIFSDSYCSQAAISRVQIVSISAPLSPVLNLLFDAFLLIFQTVIRNVSTKFQFGLSIARFSSRGRSFWKISPVLCHCSVPSLVSFLNC